MSYTIQNGFNAGELSPLLEGRDDLEFYYRGCASLENFLVLKQGGAERRPGTEYRDTCSQPADGSRGTFVRAVPFEYSTEQAYILVFGDLYMRVYKDGTRVDNASKNIEAISISGGGNVNIQITGHGYSTGDVVYIAGTGGLTPDLDDEYVITVVDADNFTLDNTPKSNYSGTWDSAGTATEPVELTTVYASTALSNLRFKQSADTLYITDLSHTIQPYKVTRTSDTAWTITAIDPSNGPFQPLNTTATTITPSAVTGTITLTASAALFDADHVGARFEIRHIAATSYHADTFAAPGNGANSILIMDSIRIVTHGTWTGVLQLQRSTDGSNWYNWGPVLTSQSDGTNYDETFEQDDNTVDTHYRVVAHVLSAGTAYVRISMTDTEIRGVAKITVVTNSTTATATVERRLGGTTATADWREGAWGTYRGFPGTMAFFQQRTMWGGTAFQPQTVWGSKTSDFEEFQDGANDDDAVTYTIDSDQVNTIKWLVAHNVLLIGTSGGEWKLFGGGSTEPITPSNVQILPQSDRGSADVPGVLLDDAVLFVRRGGKQIRELIYSFESDGYMAPDRTNRAEHITTDAIIDMVRQKDPESLLWCVLDDGNMIVLAYDRLEEVFAWTPISTTGDFESVARIPGTNGDEIYVTVLRTIDGTDYRYLERFKPRTFSAIANAFFVDAGKTVTGSGLSSITTATHLEGAKIAVLGDGAVIYDGTEAASTVSSGTVTFPAGTTANTIQYGLSFTSTLETMPLSVPRTRAQGIKKKISQVIGKFIKTANGEVNGNNGNQDLGLSYGSTVTTKKLPVLNRHDRDGQVQVIQSDPLPMTIIMLGIEWE